MRISFVASCVGRGAAFVIGSGLAAGVASAQSFSGMGFMAGGTESYARAVSDNGVAAGYGFIPPENGPTTGFRAFGWMDGGGMVNLGTLPNGQWSAARSISNDGSVIVGWSGTATNDRAILYTGGVMTDLGVLPGRPASWAYDVSDDGSAIAGYSGTLTTGRAYRWSGGVMTDLGLPSGKGWVSSKAWGISGDGAVVVGYANKSKANSEAAFRWAGGSMALLGTLRGGSYSEAIAADADGSVVVGFSASRNGDRAFRWTGGTMSDLGTLGGYPYSYARDVSGDGSIVVGYATDGSIEVVPASGSNVTTGHAFLWSSATGMVDLNSYLPTLGIDLTDWELREARGISPDGTTIVGWGWHDDALNGTSSPEAWIARLVP